MGKKIELTSQQVQRCYELHEKRLPYVKIALELGVDRRIVAKIIKAKDQESRVGRLGDARRDVAASYFKEHIKNMELISHYLLELAIPPQMKNIPLIITNGVEAALSVKFKEATFAKKAMDHPLEDSDMTEALLIDKRMAGKEAQETIQAHQEHFSVCWQKIHQWDKLAIQYNSAFGELEKVCKTIEIPQSFIRSVIFTIIKTMEVEDLDVERPRKISPTIISSTQQSTLKLLNYRPARRAIIQIIQTKNGFADIFKQIENILSLFQQHKTILATHCKFCPVP